MTFTINPVLDRELKERVRGRRSVILLTLFLIVLSLVTFFVAWAMSNVSSDPFSSITTTAKTGRTMFEVLLIAMIGLVCVITPGLTAAAIAAERDRQTLVPMLVTLLGPRSILIGKLLAALAFLTLLILAATPLLAVCVVFGGVTIVAVLKTVLALLVTVVVLGSVSLLCSVFFRRVQTATLAAYMTMFALMVGPLFGFAAIKIIASNTSHNGPRVSELATRVFILHPLVGTADLLRDSHSLNDPNSTVIKGIQSFVNPAVPNAANDQGFNNGPSGIVVNGVFVNGGFGGGNRRSRHGAFWVWWLVSSTVVSGLSLLLAGRRLRAPSTRTLDR
jgi:ABC-type transport system involved in multi-copper enzyme maturation permease subunit